MFYCPYENYMRQTATASPTSHYRLLHAAPGTGPVDVHVNGKIVARNLRYLNFTNYFSAPSGVYSIKVYPAGKSSEPLIDTKLQLVSGSIYTLATVGDPDSIGLQPISEPLPGPTPNYAMVRFAHLAPGTPEVNITLPDGKKLFSNVSYKELTEYIQLAPGNYGIEVISAANNKRILIVPRINLQADKIYTIYAVGKLNANPPLQVLIPLDGSTYLRY